MTLEQQVCSLELAKRLKELGVKQDGYHTWLRNRHDKPYIIDQGGPFETADEEAWYSAFTVAELGEMLPSGTKSVRVYSDGQPQWACKEYEGTRTHHQPIEATTEADARAMMLVYLLENSLIKPEGMAA